MPEKNSPSRLKAPLLLLLAVAALGSLAIGVRHCLQYGSIDFQWAGARALTLHVDPWYEALHDYPHHIEHFSPPNYLHHAYLLLLPFGLVNFTSAAMLWCATSILFSTACVLLLKRFFVLDAWQAAVALCLLWIGSPFRVVLQVGQLSLLELFFFALAFAALTDAGAGLAFGLSFAKYSFSPPAAILFLFRGRIKLLLYAAIIPIAGLLIVFAIVHTPLGLLAGEPFKVSQSSATSVNPGFADLMTFVEQCLQRFKTPEQAQKLAYAFGTLAGVIYAAWLSRYKLTRQAELALLSLATLFFIKHLVYDYVFLLAPLCFALSSKDKRLQRPVIAGVLIFWLGAPVLSRASHQFTVHLGLLAINVALLASLLGYTTFAAIRAERTETA